MKDAVPAEGSAEPVETPSNKARKVKYLLWFWVAALLWLYVITKLFVYDFDTLFVARYFPDLLPIYNFKLLIILVLTVTISLISRKLTLVLFGLYIVVFPLTLFFTKLLPALYYTKSWTVAIVVIGLFVSFFKSLRYKLMVTAASIGSLLTIFTVNNKKFLLLSGAVLILALISIYIKTFVSFLRPDPVIKLYEKAMNNSKRIILEDRHIDEEIRSIPVENMSDEQLTKWRNSLQTTVLANRAGLFVADKLRVYSNSGVGLLSGVVWAIFLTSITIITFWLLNKSLFEATPSQFKTDGMPDSFLFFYMSFRTFFFGSIDEIKPSGTISRLLSVGESGFAFLMVGVFIAVVISYRSTKFSTDLEDVIQGMRRASSEIEIYLTRRYAIQSVDEAMLELERFSASFVKLAEWLTRSTRRDSGG